MINDYWWLILQLYWMIDPPLCTPALLKCCESLRTPLTSTYSGNGIDPRSAFIWNLRIRMHVLRGVPSLTGEIPQMTHSDPALQVTDMFLFLFQMKLWSRKWMCFNRGPNCLNHTWGWQKFDLAAQLAAGSPYSTSASNCRRVFWKFENVFWFAAINSMFEQINAINAISKTKRSTYTVKIHLQSANIFLPLPGITIFPFLQDTWPLTQLFDAQLIQLQSLVRVSPNTPEDQRGSK